MSETQEKFLKVLESLVELAATKKNTLEYDEIVKAFDGMELSEEAHCRSPLNTCERDLPY